MAETDPKHPMIDAVNNHKARLLRRERETAMRLVNTYGNVYQRLLPMIDALDKEIAAMDKPTRAKVMRLERFKALKKQIEDEVGKFGIYANEEMQAAIRQTAAEAIKEAEQLVLLGFPKEVAKAIIVEWNRLPVEAIRAITDMLKPGAPLSKALVNQLGPEVSKQVMARILDGIALGYNPRKTARIIRDTLGLGLEWALRTVRTAQLYAYRRSTRGIYQANSDIVKGWVWHAKLDDRVCMSCVAMHGSYHTNDEELDDHHNGRCAMVPVTVSWKDLGFEGIPETGIDPAEWDGAGQRWFDGLTDAQKRELMPSAAHWRAWQAGAITWKDISGHYDDKVYGKMRRTPSLKDILGDAAQNFY